AVRAEVVAHGHARVVERAELRDLHAGLAERAARGDANERVALEQHDVAIRGVGALHLDQTAGDFELSAGRLLVARRGGTGGRWWRRCRRLLVRNGRERRLRRWKLHDVVLCRGGLQTTERDVQRRRG